MERPELAVIYGGIQLSEKWAGSSQPLWITPLSFATSKLWPGGNGCALYRRSIWEKRAFTLDLPTAEDLEWMLWALNEGYHALSYPDASVLYRNRSSLRRMFQKGLTETRVMKGMLGAAPAGLQQVVLGFGSLAKKYALREIPLESFARQLAHQTGAIYGSWLPPLLSRSPRSNPVNGGSDKAGPSSPR